MNPNWNVSGLILEGVCGSGKSTLLAALLRSEGFVERGFVSSIVVSEHQTQRVLERKEREEGLVREDNVGLLDQHVSYIESVKGRLDAMRWCGDNRTNMRVPYLLERFHFTHVGHYAHMRWEDVAEIDRRLAEVNCKVCLLTADEAALHERIIAERSGVWRDYLKRFGGTDAEIVDHYLAQQGEMRAMCARSAMETLVVDTSKASIEKTLGIVMEFWGAMEEGGEHGSPTAKREHGSRTP